MKKRYVLVDYENVQPKETAGLDTAHLRVFIGANQCKIDFEIAALVQGMGARGEYIKISGTGRNALDFHIACHLGELLAKEPGAQFHIISKDTGFDPLVAHLRARKVAIQRNPTMKELSAPKKAKPPALPKDSDRLGTIEKHLAQNKAARPRTVKTLGNAINGRFGKQLLPSEVECLIAELAKRKVIEIKESRVTYP